jgi:hypothetical protein
MKVINKNYQALGMPVLDITLRSEVGESIDLSGIGEAGKCANRLLSSSADFSKIIAKIRDKCVFNLGEFGAVSGKYILDSLINHKKGKSK